MDLYEKQNIELQKVEKALHKKFKDRGLNTQQIEFKMMQLDVDFLIHSYVNGIPKTSVKQRLEFYIETLKMYYDEE